MFSQNTFEHWKVSQLQDYLKERGVTCSKYKKYELVELCELANKNDLEVDPYCLNDSVQNDIIQKLNINGTNIKHPDSLIGSTDLSFLPNIDHFDIYNYLVTFKQMFEHRQLKAYKSLDGYQLYEAGYVESLKLCSNVGAENIHVIKFDVKPKQRNEDPLNKVPFYKGWIILDGSNPSIEGAYCACKGGADGACRHTVAALYEISEYANEANKESVTSAACQWKKKSRQNYDKPVPITLLKTALPGSTPKVSPTMEYYDPCPGVVPDVNQFYEGLKILHPRANMLLNRYKNEELNPPKEIKCSVPPLLDQLKSKASSSSIISNEDFLSLVKFTDEDVIEIERCTRGQNDNSLWHQYRKGMLTASNFFRISRLKESTNPEKLISTLMGECKLNLSDHLPAPLEWGRKKEVVARKLFLKMHKVQHRSIVFEERGLVVCNNFYFMGASPDGYCYCTTCGEFLLEIKCPYKNRNFSPRVAAKDHCFIDANKNLQLDPKSQYYTQIQGQLAICKLQLCKLVIFTTKGITVVDVNFDEGFWKNLEEKLKTFYIKHLGPATLQSLMQ